jgi:hypothetical protein
MIRSDWKFFSRGKCSQLYRLISRLLTRVLKEGSNFGITIHLQGGGGVRENVPLENLWNLCYFMSVSVPSSFEIFQTYLALWVCAAMLLYLTTTFSFSQVHHQIDQNVKCIIIMRIEEDILIYLINKFYIISDRESYHFWHNVLMSSIIC